MAVNYEFSFDINRVSAITKSVGSRPAFNLQFQSVDGIRWIAIWQSYLTATGYLAISFNSSGEVASGLRFSF